MHDMRGERDGPTDTRPGLAISTNSGALLIRARAYHAKLVKDGKVVDSDVSLHELSYLMLLGFPMGMLYPRATQEHSHVAPRREMQGLVPREPTHVRTDGARFFVLRR